MRLSLDLGLGSVATMGVASPDQYASGPAPTGYRWDFVTENGVRVFQDNEPVVDLVRVA